MPMKLKAQLMDDVTVKRALTRLSYEIIEKSRDLENVVLIGIKTRGVPLAEQIAANIETHTGVKVQTCTLDITFYFCGQEYPHLSTRDHRRAFGSCGRQDERGNLRAGRERTGNLRAMTRF